MKIPKLRLVLLAFLLSVFSCFVIAACTSEQPKRTVGSSVTPTATATATPTPEPTATPTPELTATPTPKETPSPTDTSTSNGTTTRPTINPPDGSITLPKIRQINPCVVDGILSNHVQTEGRVTLGQVYRCEPTKNTYIYRVTPSIAGSCGLLIATEPLRNCFVPVTNKRCFYRNPNSTSDFSSSKEWYECGRGSSYAKGIGEVQEFRDGKEYHSFESGVEFTFQ